MANKQNEIIYDGQNRCRRCDRPLKDPTANYGWWCAKLVGLDTYQKVASTLDEDQLKGYNAYVTKYFPEDTKVVDDGFSESTYNYNADPRTNPSGILNMGYDSTGVWHDWDAERYGVDSPTYKMLSGLNTAYERANIYGHWSGDKERIADLAATLRVTDTRITDAIVLNNRQGAGTAGHNAILLLNPSGQGFYFSYSSANGYPDDIGEMRFSILSADDVNELKDRSGIMNESVTIYGDRRWEKNKDAYDRFAWCDLPNMEAGKRMFQYAADIFSNPGHYNVVLYKGGQQCDYMVQQILAAGGIEYEKKVFPNNSFELFRTGKTYWEN